MESIEFGVILFIYVPDDISRRAAVQLIGVRWIYHPDRYSPLSLAISLAASKREIKKGEWWFWASKSHLTANVSKR